MIPAQAKLNSVQIWTLAARPKTLPAAAAPVIVGSALAYLDGRFRFWPALAALAGALLLQIGANFANDVFDFHKGADTSQRLGPLRVTQAGLLSPRQVYLGMWLTFGLAALTGLYLIWLAGWPVLMIGVLSIIAALAYTGGPFPLGYNGLGEPFVFLFFGLAAVGGTYFVQAETLTPLAFWSAWPMGFLSTAILVVNNLRDIETDRTAGKHTMAVRLGESRTRLEWLAMVVLAYLFPLGLWLVGLAPAWALMAWLSLPAVFPIARLVFKEKGRTLNLALAGTGRIELLFGLCFSLGLVLGRLL